MLRTKVILGTVLVTVLAVSSPVIAVNQVTVESMELLEPGATGIQVGVYLTNDVTMSAGVFPFELRSQIGTAFIVNNLSLGLNPSGRCGSFGDFPTASTQGVPAVTNTCSGPDRLSYPGGAGTPADFISPDACLYAGVVVLSPKIAPGTDGIPGSGTPSLLLTLDLNSDEGCFLIDTCCVQPGNHLYYSDENNNKITPNFEPGQICIGVNDVKEVGGGVVPESFELGQNYPNPFNAGTVIPFNTSEFGHVSMDVYDILGRHVTNLVNQDLDAGKYNADWDGTGKDGSPVATGVYFYRIVTTSNVQTRKMLLIK